MEEGLRRRINFDDHEANLIVSRCLEELVDLDKKNIIWQHLNYNEPLTQGMFNKFFIRSIDAFVYVSHWQYEKYRYIFKCPTDNVYVIKNAINPIEFIDRPKSEKIRLIYTSAPYRGLELLLDAFEILNRDDVELDVYSSTIIYGSDFNNEYYNKYKNLFDKARSLKNVNYHGYVTNDQIINALQQSHIFAYPSIFEETCCLSLIEAGAAGCSIVSHNLGAIYETVSEYGLLLPVRIDNRQMILSFADALNHSINDYKNKKDLLKKQSDYFNYFYSWDKAVEKWNKVIEFVDC